MAQALHRAIRDALRDAPGYASKGILVGTFLEATRSLEADDTLLYRSVYTIFRALPARLIAGSALNISTVDTDDGIELVWEGRERLQAGEGKDLRAILGQGPHGDLVEIAVVALEQFCHLRAGFMETRRERVEGSTAFDRPAYVVRRVRAHIPARARPPSPQLAGAPPVLHDDLGAGAAAQRPPPGDALQGGGFRACV